MASIKIKFRTSSVEAKEGTIYYQVIHDRKARYIVTDYHLFSSEWNEKREKIRTATTSSRQPFLLSLRERIDRDMERLAKIVRNLDSKGLPYDVEVIIEKFNHYTREYSLFNFMKALIFKMKCNGKIRTSETYTSALNSFRKFRKNEDIMLDAIDSDLMEAYEAWHKSRGNTANTISFYTRILRAVYNRAVENEIIENRCPFRHVYTGVDKTVKRALPLPVIRKIKNLDLSLSPTLDFARDIFILSFMLRGMSFIDMAFLKKTDFVNGYIIYRRRKTGQQLIIEWTKEMQEVLDKYPETTSEYFLPIIKSADANKRSTYRNVNYNINRNLKKIAEMVGITAPLTLYVARHSWASAAHTKGIPISIISEGMGHDSETTTRIYLASLDTSLVDKANSLILKSIK